MLQLKNHSPFCPSINLFPDENGIDTLYVVVKATFLIEENGVRLSEEQIPPQQADEYWGEPVASSLKYMSEMHPGKSATDIVVNGFAYAPEGIARTRVDCGIKVGDYSKQLTVFGDRFWQGNKITDPKPFKKMQLIYENAFGGSYIEKIKDGKGGYEEIEKIHPQNPVGRGFRKPGTKPGDGEKLPNIENPDALISSSKDQPTAVGLGFISAGWEPRLSFAGTYDEQWQKNRAPYLPTDFDKRFFNAALSDLTAGGFLQGGESVILVNLCQLPRLKFFLPRCEPGCEIDIDGNTESPTLNLETILIEPEDDRFTMTWRAKLNCDKKALKISEVRVFGGLNDQDDIAQQ